MSAALQALPSACTSALSSTQTGSAGALLHRAQQTAAALSEPAWIFTVDVYVASTHGGRAFAVKVLAAGCRLQCRTSLQLQAIYCIHPKDESSILLKRGIGCRLPSFNAEFTASTPLTRIRDIAHRSDIPHDLKQEIKHTIQVASRRSSILAELCSRAVSASC